MRQIKFRGWDEKNKEMVDNINLLFSNHLNDCFEEYEECGLKIMQYTGLKDKNGKEIYEGDIVRVFQPFNVPTKAIVELSDGCFELNGIELTWRDYVKCFVANHAIEIIGNIHEGVQE